MTPPLASRLLLGAAVVSQLAVPLTMVGERAWTLRHGERVLMRCEPIDPYDAFRGRYVALSIEGAVVETDPGLRDSFGEGSRERGAYLELIPQADGFVKPGKLSLSHPTGPGLRVKVKIRRWGRNGIRVRYPFDRYYMEEKQAPRAEALYRENALKHDAHVAVRIGPDGMAVLEELYLGNQPVYQALQSAAADR